MDIDSKVDTIVVDHKDNHRAWVAASVQSKLNECIKVLEAKKAQVTLEAKLCSLEQEQMHGYLEVNVSIGSVTSLKDILAIGHGQVCLDSLKYSDKSMKYYKSYKHSIKYMLEERQFMYCTNKEKCTYARQFLTGIPAEHWKTIETQIKESSTLEFNYEAFMKMLKEYLLPWLTYKKQLLLSPSVFQLPPPWIEICAKLSTRQRLKARHLRIWMQLPLLGLKTVQNALASLFAKTTPKQSAITVTS